MEHRALFLGQMEEQQAGRPELYQELKEGHLVQYQAGEVPGMYKQHKKEFIPQMLVVS